MKPLFSIIFLLTSVTMFGQTIQGTIIDNYKSKLVGFAIVQLMDTSEVNILHGTHTDSNGKFIFSNILIGVYSIKITDTRYADTIYRNIKIYGDTTLELDIHRFCKYDRSLNNRHCPVCHKVDKVIPIKYGLLISTKGNPMKNEGKTFRVGGCKVSHCDPHWYCKKDKLEF